VDGTYLEAAPSNMPVLIKKGQTTVVSTPLYYIFIHSVLVLLMHAFDNRSRVCV